MPKEKVKGALFTGARKEGKNLKDNIAMQRLHCSDGRDNIAMQRLHYCDGRDV